MAAALGAACELARTNLDVGEPERLRALRDHFWQALQAIFGERVVLNGHAEHRLPNTLNVNFAGRIGAEVLADLDGVAASTGSACHAGRVELSPVLAAMGVPEQVGMRSAERRVG